MDRAWDTRDSGIQFLLVDPFILRYAGDARFAAFCRKAGLPTTTTAKALPCVLQRLASRPYFAELKRRNVLRGLPDAHG